MKYILVLMFALFLNACAIFGDPTELDDTKGWTAERIYAEGQAKMLDKDYEKAIKYFGKLESRYPNGRYAAQAQLETAYAHYKQQEPVLCVAAADRFWCSILSSMCAKRCVSSPAILVLGATTTGSTNCLKTWV